MLLGGSIAGMAFVFAGCVEIYLEVSGRLPVRLNALTFINSLMTVNKVNGFIKDYFVHALKRKPTKFHVWQKPRRNNNCDYYVFKPSKAHETQTKKRKNGKLKVQPY